MQKRITLVLATTVLVLCTAALMQAKTNSMGIAEKQTITFHAPTVVGGTLLPAGNYTVLHEMDGTEHIMVFKQVGGKTEVKAKCNLVPLPEKAAQTEYRECKKRACPGRNDLPWRLREARSRAVTANRNSQQEAAGEAAFLLVLGNCFIV